MAEEEEKSGFLKNLTKKVSDIATGKAQKDEIAKSKNSNNKVAFFSKRFAAKEAFSKALGLGFRNSLNFKDISIVNNKYGKPSIKIKDKLQNIIKKQFKTNKVNILLSISDENKYSIAFVILEKI